MARSLLYRIVEAATAIAGFKRVFRLSAKGLKNYLEKNRGKQNNKPPAYIEKKHTLARITIEGRQCYIISPKNALKNSHSEKKAVLFIHGGGYIFEAHRIHWRAASLLAGTLGIPVWFPVYPLLPDDEIPKALSFIVSVYAKMLERHQPNSVVILGDSAGAALALSLCHQIDGQGESFESAENALLMPGKLVLLSPVALLEHNKAIREAMRRLEPKDVMLSMNFLDSIIEVFHIDADTEKNKYCYLPFLGDFSRFPKMHIFSGTFECAFPQIEAFAKRLSDAGISADFYAGQEMMHIWPYMPAARECKKALDLIFDIIRGAKTPHAAC